MSLPGQLPLFDLDAYTTTGSASRKMDGVIAKITAILDDYIQLEKEYIELAEAHNALIQQTAQQKQQIDYLEEKIKLYFFIFQIIITTQSLDQFRTICCIFSPFIKVDSTILISQMTKSGIRLDP